MITVTLLRKSLITVILSFFFIIFSIVISQSDELKKINEDLKSIKNLYETGVLDEESYNSSRKRLNSKKNKILSKKNNSDNTSSQNSKTLEKQLDVLEKLFNDGTLSEEEFLKTKKFLTEKETAGENIDLNDYKSEPANYVLNVKKDPGRKNWEKAEIIYDDYRISTYRPSGIKVVRISDNKTLLKISDNYKIKYYNNGENVITIKKKVYTPKNLSESVENLGNHLEKQIDQLRQSINNLFTNKKIKKDVFDTESHKLELFINNKRILHYVGRRVPHHKAFFYQVLTDRSEPFHFYIKIDAKAAIALNMEYFRTRKIYCSV